MKILNVLIIADPVASFDPVAETTFYMIKELNRKKHGVYIATLDDLFIEEGSVQAIVHSILVTHKRNKFTHKLSQQKQVKLHEFDVILLRKDPPVDLTFLNHLAILQVLESSPGQKTIFVNSPKGIRYSNEKLLALEFKNISPETMVTKSREKVIRFIKDHKKVVLKPLNEAGGRGVCLLTAKDKNLEEILESTTHDFHDYVELQKFIPAIKQGDKRILLLGGEPLGAFLRVPAKGDFRGNLHSGATAKKCSITPAEKSIIAQIRPRLLELGLHFVGLDVIGGLVTEINSTSPMGFGELNHFENSQIERTFVRYLESLCKSV